jgi:methylenetetrahydrofolate dehydrogenase (NADP+)/methenyltetrahydrofolate cyclohydrolase
MTGRIIDGRAIARTVRAEVAARVAVLAERGVTPGLTVILAGDDPASQVYVRSKERMAGKVGIDAETIRMPASVTAAELRAEIERLNSDPNVDGILVQLPLPSGISRAEENEVLESISPYKDVDGLHSTNLGRLVAGEDGFVACTPSGCMRMLAESDVQISGRKAVVLGRSTIVGKPMALLLMAENATVTICHSRTKNIEEIVRESDIVIAAVGRPEMVRGDWIKPGAAVIDVGINRNAEGKLLGDVAFEEVLPVAGAVSPVPGGVGPMTIAYLLSNVCRAAQLRAQREG